MRRARRQTSGRSVSLPSTTAAIRADMYFTEAGLDQLSVRAGIVEWLSINAPVAALLLRRGWGRGQWVGGQAVVVGDQLERSGVNRA